MLKSSRLESTLSIKKLIIRMPLFLLCASIVMVTSAFGAEDKYTMEDLRVLDKQGDYTQLIEHMNDIRPTKRNEEWQALVQRAAVKLLEQRLAANDENSALIVAENIFESNLSLQTSQEFMGLRRKAVIGAFTTCFQNRYSGGDCTEELRKIVNKQPVDRELAFKAGKLVRLNMNHRAAVPFFSKALKGQQNEKWCADKDVFLAVVSGMSVPEDRAKESQELGFSMCGDSLKTKLMGNFYENHSGYAGRNYCKILSEKNMLSEFQQAFCADIKK